MTPAELLAELSERQTARKLQEARVEIVAGEQQDHWEECNKEIVAAREEMHRLDGEIRYIQRKLNPPPEPAAAADTPAPA